MARKKALNKDIRVEIKKSLGRYISIFLIVALGVSFFSGLRSTESDMRYTCLLYTSSGRRDKISGIYKDNYSA